MKRKKIPCPRPCGRDDRSDPHRLRTAGCPLRLVLWRRRQRPSRGNEKSLVTESVELENKLKAYLDLSETTASARAKETLEEVAKGFDATWLTTNNGLNETAVNALKSITDDKLELTQRLCVDVMELTPSGRTAVTIPDNREIYSNSYWDPGPESGGPHYDSCLTNYGQLKNLLSYLHRNGVELYAGTFQKGDKTYAAMVIIF